MQTRLQADFILVVYSQVVTCLLRNPRVLGWSPTNAGIRPAEIVDILGPRWPMTLALNYVVAIVASLRAT